MSQRLCLLLALCAAALQPLRADDSAKEAQFLTNPRQLIYEGRRSGESYFSSDGKFMVFQSEREPDNPFYQIYLLNLETGDVNRVSPGAGKTTCAFLRPGSDDVLFASTHVDPEAKAKQKAELDFRATGKSRRYAWDYDDRMELFVAKRDGSNIRRLTDAPGYDAEGSYSPDGKLIAFCSMRHAFPLEKLSPEDRKRMQTDPSYFGDIYLMNADGSNVRRLTSTPGYDGGPFFSPDGQRIIWRRFNEKGDTADVYTMKLDGSDVRRLTDFGAMSWAPYFHPSGQYVIYTANKLGFANFELFIVDALGTKEPVRVTYTDGFDGLPVFSPDGKKLAWTSGRTPEKNSQIFMADWNHTAALAALAQAPARSGASGQSSVASGQSKTASTEHATRSTQPAAPKLGSFSAEIKADDARAQVSFLASEALEGRLTGTSGAQQAAAFIADYFKAINLQPLPGSTNFFQPFEFSSGVRVLTNQNSATLHAAAAPATLALDKDFRPLAFTANGTVEGEVVFAGYGLSVPGKLGEGYDSYAGLDVSNKVVLVLRYVPEEADAKRRQELNRYAGLRYKALIARNRGAKALLVVTGPTSPNAGELAKLTFETGASHSGIVCASINGDTAAKMFAAAGKDLKKIQAALDKEDPHAEGAFALKNVAVKLSAAVEHVKKQDRNVLAHLPPVGTSEYVIVGAHYDHLGHGETGGFARKDEEGKVHPGADDNASGTAALLELAGAISAQAVLEKPSLRRGIIFAAWSGEEVGLIGSAHFAEHPAVPLSNVVAYVNFDMVGRLRDNKLNLQGIGSSPAWRKLIEKRNVAAGFNLTLQEDPYLPTDTTPFYPKNVPVIAFFTGSHEEYHRPADKPDTLNYEGLERITKFARALVTDLMTGAERPAYAKVEKKDGGGGREQLRAYLGTIPDYAQEVAGVKLSGTRGGSPAEKAGLKGGDVIVEFAGQKITNIYDYTYAMEAVKIGQPVKVIVLRDGKRVELTATPEVRK
ncbi:MAG: M20/M25/M40 family metallo-hydrolase [Verrucomicrobia bacterium]|nr:M20/M25/M40 family metallo-hydrolase [Verrucomicrobiota bacterium]NBU09100.1 M20/M25/M40 family metallo-hydrolase [Pseudomonadota bacterium]NDB75494.1 M20/M25/M40 family metallo-hydrolase [Verrucomicrobiota bacterium]NDD37053.1 M20/M25/M40 family metallo-hydrolase [Verrucomicrobiota bacterium]NDE98038.1 M20/M25/M40 family metallo-hydrolase [Verrucomicrobiota bacterium]